MGHGNLSPRQKMINIMYLILTALLAMNVSAEVLNAFVLVNDSLVQTEDGISTKNSDVLKKFANMKVLKMLTKNQYLNSDFLNLVFPLQFVIIS